MFVGHYSASFAGKKAEPRLPLWLLFIAVQFVDVLWGIFVLLGVEKVRIVPGFTASNALDLYYMPYTHSLAAALAWSAFAFCLCQLVPSLRGMRTGLVLGAAVLSHWVLDLLVHVPDLTLAGGNVRFGFGLWNHRLAAFVLEMAVLWGGAYVYGLKRRVVLFVALLSMVQWVSTFYFPPPSSDRSEAGMALLFYFLFAVAAWWVERGHENTTVFRASAS